MSSHTTISVIAVRTPMAPTVPQMMAFFCRCLGRLRAARAMTMALSPASTRSIRMMAISADHQAVENSSMRNKAPKCVPGRARVDENPPWPWPGASAHSGDTRAAATGGRQRADPDAFDQPRQTGLIEGLARQAMQRTAPARRAGSRGLPGQKGFVLTTGRGPPGVGGGRATPLRNARLNHRPRGAASRPGVLFQVKLGCDACWTSAGSYQKRISRRTGRCCRRATGRAPAPRGRGRRSG